MWEASETRGSGSLGNALSSACSESCASEPAPRSDLGAAHAAALKVSSACRRCSLAAPCRQHSRTGTVPGAFLGVEGHGRRISFRMLHVWEFRDGLISRENVWFDDGAILRQLATPQAATVAGR